MLRIILLDLLMNDLDAELPRVGELELIRDLHGEFVQFIQGAGDAPLLFGSSATDLRSQFENQSCSLDISFFFVGEGDSSAYGLRDT